MAWAETCVSCGEQRLGVNAAAGQPTCGRASCLSIRARWDAVSADLAAAFEADPAWEPYPGVPGAWRRVAEAPGSVELDLDDAGAAP